MPGSSIVANTKAHAESWRRGRVQPRIGHYSGQAVNEAKLTHIVHGGHGPIIDRNGTPAQKMGLQDGSWTDI
jgi:hypothetical protein